MLTSINLYTGSLVTCCILCWPVFDRRSQMNGKAIPWRIFFYQIRLYCQPKRWKNRYHMARCYLKTAHLYFDFDWEIQGVKQVLYSYKILFFQTAPLKSYRLSKLLYLSPFHEKFKRYLKIFINLWLVWKKSTIQETLMTPMSRTYCWGLKCNKWP